MTTSDAIEELRKAMDNISQEKFARLAGTTAKTIWRYENGRKPTVKSLDRLAEIARKANRDDLGECFAKEKERMISASVGRLLSPGSARRIPYWQVKAWSDDLVDVYKDFQKVSHEISNYGESCSIKDEIEARLTRVLDSLHPWLTMNEDSIKKLESQNKSTASQAYEEML